MAIKKELIIEIKSDGTLNITTHGLKGVSCEDELKPIEAAIGKRIASKRTAEFYEKSDITSQVKNSSKAK